MNDKIEKALFVHNTLPAPNEINRLYFGNEFCEHLFPNLKDLKKYYALATNAGKKFTLVTPFSTNRGLATLSILLKFLDRQNNIEIVFNDWGIFYLLKKEFGNLTPVMGRLLTKQYRDPRLKKVLLGTQKKRIIRQNGTKTLVIPKKIPPSLYEYYQASLTNVPLFQDFLLSQGIKRVELDNLIWNMHIQVPKDIGISFYFPYGYISTGRTCWAFSRKADTCDKRCQSYYLKMTHSSSPVPLYEIGGTIFYKYDALPLKKLASLKNPGLRIVFQTKLPF